MQDSKSNAPDGFVNDERSPSDGDRNIPVAQRTSFAKSVWIMMRRPIPFRYLALGLVLLLAALTAMGCWMFVMPGESFHGPLPAMTDDEAALADQLRADIHTLAGDIGERNVTRPAELARAEEYLTQSLSNAGFSVQRQTFRVNAVDCSNLEVEIPGTIRGNEILVIGAHYDSAEAAPGANDNGSGAVAVVVLARRLAKDSFARTVRFVLFVNEEPPHFQTDAMGSLVYAKRCKQRNENIVGMISLETIGYFNDTTGSQKYPPPLDRIYPAEGNFIGFVADLDSITFLRRVVKSFRGQCSFPSEGAALPGFISEAGWSDHWSFWQQGYPALMVTDTAPFRYPYYHTTEDTPDRIDYARMARVVAGMERVIRELAK